MTSTRFRWPFSNRLVLVQAGEQPSGTDAGAYVASEKQRLILRAYRPGSNIDLRKEFR